MMRVLVLGTLAFRGWREPGNKTLQRGRIFVLVLFKKRVLDQEGRPAGQYNNYRK